MYNFAFSLTRMFRMQPVRLAHPALMFSAHRTTHRMVASAVQPDTAYNVSPSDVSSDGPGPETYLPDFPTLVYDRNFANYISLIGHLGNDPEFLTTPSGRHLAKMRLAVNRGTEAERITDWYDVETWGDLAKQCDQHLRKGAWINIQGRVKVDTWQDKETQAKRSRVQIVATRIDRMQSAVQPGAMPAGGSAQYSPQAEYPQQQYSTAASTSYASPAYDQAYSGAAAPGGYAGTAPRATYQDWEDLMADPGAFWDNRESKRNPRGPDFKHKRTGVGLWLSSAPLELQAQLDAAGLSAPLPF